MVLELVAVPEAGVTVTAVAEVVTPGLPSIFRGSAATLYEYTLASASVPPVAEVATPTPVGVITLGLTMRFTDRAPPMGEVAVKREVVALPPNARARDQPEGRVASADATSSNDPFKIAVSPTEPIV